MRKGTMNGGELVEEGGTAGMECGKMKRGRPYFDKLGSASEAGGAGMKSHKMGRGRPDLDKLGRASSTKNP
jgi:hypothetical protein